MSIENRTIQVPPETPTQPAVLLAALAYTQSPAASQSKKPAGGSAGSDNPTLKVAARLVVIPTVVRDKHGAILCDLNKENFSLLIDGALQTLRYFDHDADAALTLGLLVDTSRSQARVLDDERAGSIAFLQTAVNARRDQAFVMQFAHTVELLQDVNDSRPKLQQALQQLDTTAPAQDDTHDAQPDADQIQTPAAAVGIAAAASAAAERPSTRASTSPPTKCRPNKRRVAP